MQCFENFEGGGESEILGVRSPPASSATWEWGTEQQPVDHVVLRADPASKVREGAFSVIFDSQVS